MTYESCRFLFHQFIQRDKAHEIIADTDALTPLSAALIRGSDINRLDQIMPVMVELRPRRERSFVKTTDT